MHSLASGAERAEAEEAANENMQALEQQLAESNAAKQQRALFSLVLTPAMRGGPLVLETPAKRGRGRPRRSEEEKAAIAEIRKVRRERGDEGVSVRQEMPISELQLIMRV